ncbi:MAG: SurA N-terminal domain-containing protein [Marinilabiliaceae bacterium]|nr:SurA N-terminal domain-containing protein [Marinilabiliaceae bacterium]
MATLQKIRTKGGVIVVVIIFIALMAFILNDLLNSGNSLFRGSQNDVASINGKSISIMDFHELLSKNEEFQKINLNVGSLSEDETYQVRDLTWNLLVNKTLIDDIVRKLGLSVTSDELMDMVTGNNIHHTMKQLFTDQQTGLYDKQIALKFLQDKNNDQMAFFYWYVLEERIINERLQAKYVNLIKKGMYVTKAWIEDEIANRSKSVSFDYVLARYTNIPDSIIIISEEEIVAYHLENKEQYKQEAMRDFEYITFDQIPSDLDRQNTFEKTMKMKPDFSNPETDAVQYVLLNSEEPYDDRNYKANELTPQIEHFIINAEINDVFGPYLENESYRLSRLVAINMIPDSVKARHILIQGTTLEESTQTADSLMNLIRSGIDFTFLALENSADQGSAMQGGDLGWFTEGQMVKPFNDACFLGKTGDLVSVESQFGVHIINITDQTKPIPKYQIATLEQKIITSSKTYQDVYSNATIFKTTNKNAEMFNEAVIEQNLVKRSAPNVRENERRVGSLESPREMVKWAFNAKVGDISPVFEFGNQFVIALLTQITEEGYPLVENVRQRIERELMNQKKAEMLISEFNTAIQESEDLTEIAEKMNSTVQKADNITFASYSIPGAGSEPVMVSLAVNSPLEVLSKPTKGNNAVFVINVTTEQAVDVQPETVETQLISSATQGIDYQMMETIKKNSKIKDNRSKFY